MGTFIDAIVAAISPGLGVKRERNRQILRIAQQHYQDEANNKRGYDAASAGRRVKNWTTIGSDANAQLESNTITRLRNRSRDLALNNPYVARSLKALPALIVGRGITPSITTRSANLEERLKEMWQTWAESTTCDYNGLNTFAGLQRLVVRGFLESGDVFVRRVFSNENAIGLQLQVLEADHLDSTKDGIPTDSGGYIQNGIEYNNRGKRVAYWMFDQHPGSNRLNTEFSSKRIPASNILHIFYQTRPGQERGAPLGTSSVISVKDLKEFQSTNLLRQKIAACFTAFVTSDSHVSRPSQITEDPDEVYPLEQLEPGTIERLKPGEEVKLVAPPHVENYKEFTTVERQSIAAGYDMTYEGMTSDYSNVNFSSARMGKLDQNKLVEEYQHLVVIPRFCTPVFNWFLQNALAFLGRTGQLNSIKVTWTAPRPEFIDPFKEAKALEILKNNGFKSWQEILRSLGYDPEKVRKEIEQDKAFFSNIEANYFNTSSSSSVAIEEEE